MWDNIKIRNRIENEKIIFEYVWNKTTWYIYYITYN